MSAFARGGWRGGSRRKAVPTGNEENVSGFLGRIEFGVGLGALRAVVPLGFFQIGAAMEHAVEFVHEQGDGLVALVGRDHGVERGAVDGDVTLGREPVGDGLLGIALELDADADDAFFVAEKAVGLFLHEGFEGGCKFEVDTGDDQFVLMGVSVHGTLVCCWID